MDLNTLYSDKRIGKGSPTSSFEIRTAFQRDFDRIIFSSAFRRLQNKTQVFPLPGSVFVHNRLTHSLEVASVGRSLGALVGEFICNRFNSDLNGISREFYKYSLYNVIASACLCHDIGNPAFGHSGEDAIASYFTRNESWLKAHFNDKQWTDFIHFEGNANAVRILTQQQQGKSEGGLRLTYSTIAAIAKYPCESIARDKDHVHRKKFGFFQSEKQVFAEVAAATTMRLESHEPLVYKRHPFVWLVEAADDICYTIIDLEDSHRLGIISHAECVDLLVKLIDSVGIDTIARVQRELDKIKDKNDRVSYLRAKSIHGLTLRSKALFEENFQPILEGTFATPMFKIISRSSKALQDIITFSEETIYNHRSVVEIENAGYNVMYKLLEHFVPAIVAGSDARSKSEKKALKLIPQQFMYEHGSVYERVLGVLDYVSGMTDNYATDLYRKIEGIDIGMTI